MSSNKHCDQRVCPVVTLWSVCPATNMGDMNDITIVMSCGSDQIILIDINHGYIDQIWTLDHPWRSFRLETNLRLETH